MQSVNFVAQEDFSLSVESRAKTHICEKGQKMVLCELLERLSYLHIAPFSVLNAASSYCSVFILIRYEYDRRSHCSSKMVLLIPFSKQSLLLVAFNRAPIVTLNQEAFSNVSILAFTLRTDRLQTHRFQIYAFSLAFSKSSVLIAEQREHAIKAVSLAPLLHKRCKRGLKSFLAHKLLR